MYSSPRSVRAMVALPAPPSPLHVCLSTQSTYSLLQALLGDFDFVDLQVQPCCGPTPHQRSLVPPGHSPQRAQFVLGPALFLAFVCVAGTQSNLCYTTPQSLPTSPFSSAVFVVLNVLIAIISDAYSEERDGLLQQSKVETHAHARRSITTLHCTLSTLLSPSNTARMWTCCARWETRHCTLWSTFPSLGPTLLALGSTARALSPPWRGQ